MTVTSAVLPSTTGGAIEKNREQAATEQSKKISIETTLQTGYQRSEILSIYLSEALVGQWFKAAVTRTSRESAQKEPSNYL